MIITFYFQDLNEERGEKNILDYVAENDLNVEQDNKPEAQAEELDTIVEDVEEEEPVGEIEEIGSDTGMNTEDDMKTDITMVTETTIVEDKEVKTYTETVVCVTAAEENKTDKETDEADVESRVTDDNANITESNEGVAVESDSNHISNAKESTNTPLDTSEPTFAETLWQNCLDQRPPVESPKSLLADKQTPHKYERYINGVPKKSVHFQTVSKVEPSTQATNKPGSHKSQCCVIL